MSRNALPDPSGTLLRFVSAAEFPHHLVLREHRSGRLAEGLVDLLPDARSLREPLLVLPEELVEALKLGVIQGYVDNGHPQCHALALLTSEKVPADRVLLDPAPALVSRLERTICRGVGEVLHARTRSTRRLSGL